MTPGLFALVLFGAFSTSTGEITKVDLPVEVREELRVTPTDPDIKGKVWNRWTSKNFVVCALNDGQAQFLHKHLELVKTWTYERWGLNDTDFAAECRVICVDDGRLFRKMFQIDSSRVETRMEGGRIKLSVIFLLANESPSKVLPAPLTEVCLKEFEQKYQLVFPVWARRGMALLNCSLESITTNFLALKTSLDSDSQMFFAKGLLTCTPETYAGYDPNMKLLFDRSSAAFCLLVRKEFGQDALLRLLVSGQLGAAAVKEVLGFNDEAQFDRTFKRYMVDLTNDLSTGKTPMSYLQIKEKR